jgi:acyl carrier protein
MDTKEQIKEFFEDNFMVDFEEEFNDEDSFLESGIIDSTGVLELVLFLEENFGFKVDDEEIIPENLDSFKNLQKYIAHKKN